MGKVLFCTKKELQFYSTLFSMYIQYMCNLWIQKQTEKSIEKLSDLMFFQSKVIAVGKKGPKNLGCKKDFVYAHKRVIQYVEPYNDIYIYLMFYQNTFDIEGLEPKG